MLYTNASILHSASETICTDYYLKTTADRIESTGPMSELTQAQVAEACELEGDLVIPGLVNGHNHCAMTLFRGLADDLELNDWLQNHIFPAEAECVSKEMVYWCTKLAAAEMLLSGTTTVADGYFFSAEAARALSDCMMRGVVAHGVVDFPAPSVPDPSKNIEALESYLDQWQNKNPLITPGIFAHAPYTCSPKTLRAAKKLADKRKCRFFIHIAESPHEQDKIIEPQGSTPIQHLAALNILDENTVCVHAIWLNDEDIEILARSGAAVILCPQSNLKLASGISKGWKYAKTNIPIGLGTDGCASNNGLDLFREMDIFAKIQKVTSQETTIASARQVLEYATTSCSQILGVEKIGRLAAGYQADFTILDKNSLQLSPFYNQDILVYSSAASAVKDVFIAGKQVVKNREITSFDLTETMEQVTILANKIVRLSH